MHYNRMQDRFGLKAGLGLIGATVRKKAECLEKAQLRREMLAHPSSVLRVSLPVDLATTYLASQLAEFSRRYPEISFEFDLTLRHVDLVAEPFDVAIRMGELRRLPVGTAAPG